MTTVDSPVNLDYVRYLQAKLIAAENGLLEMSQKYGDAKALFDRICAARGITPETDMLSYQEAKALHPELPHWYSKVEHYQREMAAYGAALSGIRAAQRMLRSDDDRRARANARRGPRRGGDGQRSDATAAVG
jgi:hypothetical protein